VNVISPCAGGAPAASQGPEGSEATAGTGAAVVDGAALVGRLVDDGAEDETLKVVDAATVDPVDDGARLWPDDPEHATVATRQPATITAQARTAWMLGRSSSRSIEPGRPRFP
jgi:hypothetical protein